MSARKWFGLSLMLFGVCAALVGGVVSIEASPSIAVKDCKGDVHALGFCDQSIHNVTGIYQIGLVSAIAASIVLVVVGAVVMATGKK